MPLTFLQKAHKDSLIYASWIAKNLTDMETANLNVLDPFLAYLIGIAATIHIEHSSNLDSSIANSARQKIATCMTYLSRVSSIWPKVQKRINALEELRSRVGNRSTLNYVEDEYDGAVPVRSVRHVSMSAVDEKLFWILFDPSYDAPHNSSASNGQITGPDLEQLSMPRSSPHNSLQNAAISMPPSRGEPDVHPRVDTQVGTLDPLSSGLDMAADWSLLGMPWLAYFPPDAGFSGTQ